MRLYPRCGGSIAALGMGMGLFFAVYHIVLAATGMRRRRTERHGKPRRF
ncbi:MAG: hypothetical protein ACLUI3_16820 [Christensenellales bacterium]